MAAKEVGTIALNCVIAACLFALVAYKHTITLEQAIAGVAVLLVPSAAPSIVTRLRDVFAAVKKKDPAPPEGPSVLEHETTKGGDS